MRFWIRGPAGNVAGMNPNYGPEADAYRARVKTFLAEKLPSDWTGLGTLPVDEVQRFVKAWRVTLYEAGYLAPGWPVEYGGGGLSALEQVVLAEEFAIAGVPTGVPNDGFGIQMLGNTLLLGVRKSRSGTTFLECSPARTFGVRAIPNPTPAQILEDLGCEPCWTGTNGC